MPVLKRPSSFYCGECRMLTDKIDPADLDQGEDANPRCGTCWEHYQCQECGYEIDAEGNCLRPREDGWCQEAHGD